jgi:hypothetical protein
MVRIRGFPTVVAVVLTELVLAPIGSEVQWQAGHHLASFDGVAGLLSRSIGVPWAAPWHRQAWQLNGLSTTLGLLAFLVLLAGATALITRGARGDRPFIVLFLGIWGTSVLALSISQALRLLIDGGREVSFAGGGRHAYYALAEGTASVYHAVYFGWIAALVGAFVAVASQAEEPEQRSFPVAPHYPAPQRYQDR